MPQSSSMVDVNCTTSSRPAWVTTLTTNVSGPFCSTVTSSAWPSPSTSTETLRVATDEAVLGAAADAWVAGTNSPPASASALPRARSFTIRTIPPGPGLFPA